VLNKILRHFVIRSDVLQSPVELNNKLENIERRFLTTRAHPTARWPLSCSSFFFCQSPGGSTFTQQKWQTLNHQPRTLYRPHLTIGWSPENFVMISNSSGVIVLTNIWTTKQIK